MGRPKKNDPKPIKLDDPALRLRVFIRSDMIGSGKIEMLKLLGETGSISAAAREMGIGYRRVWSLLDTMQRCFDQPLFTTSRGGGDQGGAQLTALGSELVDRFAEFEAEMHITATPFLDWVKDRQSKS